MCLDLMFSTNWDDSVHVLKSLSTFNSTIRLETARIRRIKTHIPGLNGSNGTACSNSDKAEIYARSLRSQITLNPDVVNPRMVDIVASKIEEFLHTDHVNTLNSVSPLR